MASVRQIKNPLRYRASGHECESKSLLSLRDTVVRGDVDVTVMCASKRISSQTLQEPHVCVKRDAPFAPAIPLNRGAC